MTTLIARGKVRELYELDGDLLMVASDRISTYDVVHPTAIPDKGKVLTGLSALWFDLTKDIVANHVISYTDGVPDEHRGRALRAKRLQMLPVECVVRGYISGSGWKDYQATGSVSGIELPAGPARVRPPPGADLHALDEGRRGPRRGDRLRGDGRAGGLARAGRAPARRRRWPSTRRSPPTRSSAGSSSPTRSSSSASTRTATLVLGDEVCTPDSSRFWPADQYEPGRGQPSFDKQYVRDWARGTGWDKTPPAPAIPDEVVEATRERYVTAYERLAGEPFSAWLERTAA